MIIVSDKPSELLSIGKLECPTFSRRPTHEVTGGSSLKLRVLKSGSARIFNLIDYSVRSGRGNAFAKSYGPVRSLGISCKPSPSNFFTSSNHCLAGLPRDLSPQLYPATLSLIRNKSPNCFLRIVSPFVNENNIKLCEFANISPYFNSSQNIVCKNQQCQKGHYIAWMTTPCTITRNTAHTIPILSYI